MNIYVDIDGTLTNETEGWGDDIYAVRTPKLDVIKKVNKWYDEGHEIVLWTARHIEDEKITIQWLQIMGVKYHKLILGKPHFDVYICDLSINVEDIHELNL